MKVIARVDGTDIPLDQISSNPDMGFGQFRNVVGTVFQYSLLIAVEHISERFEDYFKRLVSEMKVDDQHENFETDFAKIGYPAIREAFESPREMENIIDTFMSRDILNVFAPYSESARFVINSVEKITIENGAALFEGRAFSR